VVPLAKAPILGLGTSLALAEIYCRKSRAPDARTPEQVVRLRLRLSPPPPATDLEKAALAPVAAPPLPGPF
jgi:hypothetical protein